MYTLKIFEGLLLVLIFAMHCLSVSAESSKSPFVVGYLRMADSSDTFWGFDIAGEVAMLDSS
jgi:hypothetical protein